MPDPINDTTGLDALELVAATAPDYLDSLSTRPVLSTNHLRSLEELDAHHLPDCGTGALTAVERLLRVGTEAATHSAGPRYFHFVIGGSTTAALAADWITSLLDQNAGSWQASSLAATVETTAHSWLRDLFGFPAGWGVALTTSATYANLTGLACARHWWAAKHGRDVRSAGLAGLPAIPILSGGYVHPLVRKALQLLGLGDDAITVCSRDDAGRVDPRAMDRTLAASGQPAVIIGNAGELKAGDFDPLDELADIAERHGAWLHVDGAFGLFAALSSRTSHLVKGIERAHSVASDGHKWLNVPYESGFGFVHDATLLAQTFGAPNTSFLPTADDPHPNYAFLGPEASRRARALPIWATIQAYGRDGYRAMVERHLDLAQHLGNVVRRAPDFELLAEVQLCVVCFRYSPAGVSADRLDELNTNLGEMLFEDGRVHAGTTRYRGMVAFRPVIINWRTTTSDVDYFVDVLRELGKTLL